MKWLIFLVSLFIMSFSMSNEHTSHPTNAEKVVHKILKMSAKQIKDKYPLILCGQGASMPEGNIKKLSLSFNTKKIMQQKEIRKLLLETSECLLKMINQNDEVSIFLTKKPFTIENVQIILFNMDVDGRESYDPNIATAQIADGILTFRTLDSPINYEFNNEFTETYIEASKIVAVEKENKEK